MYKYDNAHYEKIKATGDLPSPKGAALGIIRLTQKSDVGLPEMDRAIRSDPAFVGRIIKAANLVSGPGNRAIVSVREALMVLGIPAVRSLALGFSLLSDYTNGRCSHFDFGRFWSRSLLTALAFQAINIRTRAAQSDEAFSVGLLAHIGELSLATLYPEKYDGVLANCETLPENKLMELEHETLLINHAELSAAMLSDWGLPSIYVDAIFFHEQPEKSGYSAGARPYVLCQSLNLARHISDFCLSTDGAGQGMLETLYQLGSRLSIEPDALKTLCDQVAAAWPEWASMLKLNAAPIPSFSELANLSASSASPPSNMSAALKVLVVDSDQSTRQQLKTIVEAEGYLTLFATNGEEGFTIAIQHKPDIMITGGQMPVMNGIELTRTLRQTKEGRGIYIVIITKAEDDDELSIAFEAGVDEFINKPLRPKSIATRLSAGRRMISLQRESERDREEMHRFASELSITNRRLQEMAMTDVLTGFPNRRYATDRLAREWAASTRNHRPLSCLIIDIDKFKSINDTHGHDVGDMVLQKVANTISEALRTPDVICRMGGDEFIVICPDTALDAVLACAERIRHQVENVGNSIEGKPESSVSIGVSIRDEAMTSPEDLIKRADEGAYLSKKAGRNRVSCLQAATAPIR